MKNVSFSGIKQYLLSARQWFFDTPERSLDQAYEAAQKIKQIEDQHFGGQKISLDSGYGNSVSTYFQSELRRYLNIARMRLMEFKASNLVVRQPKPKEPPGALTARINRQGNGDYASEYTLESDQYTLELEMVDKPAELLEKLKFVDSVLSKYQGKPVNSPVASRPAEQKLVKKPQTNPIKLPETESDSLYESEYLAGDSDPSGQLKSQQGSFIPRSILRTANRFKKELDPNYKTEEEIVKDFRSSRFRTRIAIRFILLLIIVPLLTQQISKNFVVGPLVDYLQTNKHLEVSELVLSSPTIQAKVLAELEQFREQLTFNRLIGDIPQFSTEELDIQLREKAMQLAEEYAWVSSEPIKNVLSDGLSLVAFAVLVATGRREIAVIKSFMDEIAYDLSDSAKAFIIILFTDVFVGFHSPHGWEVIVEKALEHFGLPQNYDFINMFIATFPVMLDAVFKYWIFRYLNQISPSAVATYKNMNE